MKDVPYIGDPEDDPIGVEDGYSKYDIYAAAASKDGSFKTMKIPLNNERRSLQEPDHIFTQIVRESEEDPRYRGNLNACIRDILYHGLHVKKSIKKSPKLQRLAEAELKKVRIQARLVRMQEDQDEYEAMCDRIDALVQTVQKTLLRRHLRKLAEDIETWPEVTYRDLLLKRIEKAQKTAGL